MSELRSIPAEGGAAALATPEDEREVFPRGGLTPPDCSELPDRPCPPPSVFCCGRAAEVQPWQMIRRNGSRDWLALYTFSGRCGTYQKGRLVRQMRAGDLLIYKPSTFQHVAPLPGERWDFFWVHFNPRLHWVELLSGPAVGRGIVCRHLGNAEHRRGFENALSRCVSYARNSNGVLSLELAMSCLEEALLIAARETVMSSGNHRLSPEIRKVIEYIGLKYRDTVRLSEIAGFANLSSSRLAHRFRSETGSSIIAYLLKLRLQDAAQQLELSGASIKEISTSVGFGSLSHFGRLFRRSFGKSPRQFRKMNGTGPASE